MMYSQPQVAGYAVSIMTPANLSFEEAVYNSKKSSSFLLHMLVMTEPHHIKTNEIVKDAYNECLQLKEYLSEYLWTESDSEGINTIQASLDELNQALDKYEMTNDMVEGEWEFVEPASCCISTC